MSRYNAHQRPEMKRESRRHGMRRTLSVASADLPQAGQHSPTPSMSSSDSNASSLVEAVIQHNAQRKHRHGRTRRSSEADLSSFILGTRKPAKRKGHVGFRLNAQNHPDKKQLSIIFNEDRYKRTPSTERLKEILDVNPVTSSEDEDQKRKKRHAKRRRDKRKQKEKKNSKRDESSSGSDSDHRSQSSSRRSRISSTGSKRRTRSRSTDSGHHSL
jgi:hypothetical protein